MGYGKRVEVWYCIVELEFLKGDKDVFGEDVSFSVYINIVKNDRIIL